MSFLDTIKTGVENLKTLEIKTVVGDFKWDKEKKTIDYDNNKVKIIMTQIDLLEGDITTTFSEDFLKPPYDEIRKYHVEREKDGMNIVRANISALTELVKLVRDELKL